MKDHGMVREVPRQVEMTPEMQYAALAVFLLALPRPASQLDTLIVLPGQGETARLLSAVHLWEAHPNIQHLLVAGSWPGETTWELPDVAYLQCNCGLTRTKGVIVYAEASNTKVQAEQLTLDLRRLGAKRVGLVAPGYHILRAWSTLVGHLGGPEGQIAVYPFPVSQSPFGVSPETGLAPEALLPGELTRIGRYRKFGDILTYEQAMQYLEWLCETDNIQF